MVIWKHSSVKGTMTFIEEDSQPIAKQQAESLENKPPKKKKKKERKKVNTLTSLSYFDLLLVK